MRPLINKLAAWVGHCCDDAAGCRLRYVRMRPGSRQNGGKAV